MSQDRVEYWWKFITDLENMYLLGLNRVDNINSSEYYAGIKRSMDYIYGFDNLEYDQGIVYGHEALPAGQYIFNGYYGAGDEDETKKDPTINYNTKCINLEYSSAPNGAIIINPGDIFINNQIVGNQSINIQLIDNTDAVTIIEGEDFDNQFVYPPDNLFDVILTSNLYIDSSGNFVNKFLRGSYPSGSYITTYQSSILTDGYIDSFGYRKNILNSNFFYQTPSNSIDVAKIVWRIKDTTDDDRRNHSYEYYIIDNRQFYGYYGWKQASAIAIIADLHKSLTESSTYDLVLVSKKMFNIVFKVMQWGIPSDFITYWEAVPKNISQIIRDLYTELENVPVGDEE